MMPDKMSEKMTAKMPERIKVTIYHNPDCGTSRNALAAIRAAGHEPRIVEYLKTPPTREEFKKLLALMKIGVRAAVRAREPLYTKLGLGEKSEDELLDAMIANPVLINRPIVTTPTAARLCRPSETVKELLGKARPQ
jgi:arsenate reductase